MNYFFDECLWAGENCILVTENPSGKPVLILREYEQRILKKMLKDVEE